jgi:hypothetical protein
MSITNDLTNKCINYLTLLGYKVWRNNNGAVYDPTNRCFRKNKNKLLGVPDIIGFHKKTGKFIGIEIKVGKDKLSLEQILFRDEALESNCICLVVKEMKDIIDKV